MRGDRYYVVQTHPRAELVAQANLQNQHFDMYYPTVINERRVRGVLVQSMDPLYSSYMFVKFDIRNLSWRAISSTRGVRCILGHDPEQPVPVRDGVVEEIRDNLAAGQYIPAATLMSISVGEIGKIIGGAFDGHRGKCTETRETRARLSLNLLGTPVELYFDMDQVVRV